MATKKDKDRRERRRVSAKAWAEEPDRSGPRHINLPKGVTMFRLDHNKRRQKVDFMPFLAGKNNRRADEGFPHYETEYEQHFVPTPDGKGITCVCAYSRWEEPCAVCAWRTKYGASADKEVIDRTKAKTRQLWLLKDLDDKGAYKVFDAGYWNRGVGFGEMMKDLSTDHPYFADPIDGETALFTVKEQVMEGGRKYDAVTRIDFTRREKAYPEDVADDAPCLDDMLIKPDYEAIWKILQTGVPDGPEEGDETRDRDREEEEDEDKPRGRGRDPEEEEEEEDNDDKDQPTAEDLGLEEGMAVTYKGDECEIKRISGDGTSLTLEDEDGKLIKAVAPEDVKKVPVADEEEEEEEEDSPPPKKKATPVKGKGKVDPEDDEDEEEDEDASDLEDDEEEDDDPPPPKKKGKR